MLTVYSFEKSVIELYTSTCERYEARMAHVEQIRSMFPKTGGFDAYIRRIVLPPLDMSRLSLAFLVGRERSYMRTPVTGHVSLLLSYKEKEGAVTSFELLDQEMKLLQLQGARSPRAFRVATAVQWIDLMADEAVGIAKNRRTDIRRLTMPNPVLIEGVEHADSEHVLARYNDFASRAGLRWSQTELLYARDFRR